MIATYNLRLVILSTIIAVIAGYAALDLAERVAATSGSTRKVWFSGGAVTMGTGIWSMHFVAVLACNISFPIHFNSLIVAGSLAVSTISSGIIIYFFSQPSLNTLRLLCGGSLIGSTLVGVHYLGMAAVQIETVKISYHFLTVLVSVGVAIAGCVLALGLKFWSSSNTINRWWKLCSAFVIVAAIAGVHYIGMAALRLHDVEQTILTTNTSIDRSLLAQATDMTTLVVLVLTLQGAFVARRLHTEVALAESQRRLATLIDSLPGIVFACSNDSTWSMNYVSEGCFELTGYHSEELIGTAGLYNAITHSEDLPRVLQTITTAVEKRQPYVIEYRILTKTGEQKWLWEKGNGVFDVHGKVLGLEGFITDISELKHSEAALKQSEQRYRKLFDSHPCPMWVYDSATLAFLAVNNAAIAHYGYSRDEFLSMTIKDIRPSSQVPHLIDPLSQLKTGINHQGVWKHQKKNGTTIDVEITCHPLIAEKSEDGMRGFPALNKVFDAVVVSAHDVTKRLQTEEALRQAEAKYRSIFENASEGIFQTTPSGAYISANPALARLFGYASPAELIATVTDVETQLYVDGDRRAEFLRLIQAHNSVSGFESLVYCKDGSTIWVSENVRTVRALNGELLCYEGTAENITERKQIEATQARFTAILDATTDFVGIADPQGKPLYMNRAWRKLLAVPDDYNISEVKIPDCHPRWASEIVFSQALPTAAADGVWTGETSLVNHNGEEVPVSQVVIAQKSADGNVNFLATIARDITERKRLEAQLSYLANHDSLTGLFNRRYFQAQLEHHLELAQHHCQSGALILIDLDDFKDINDTLGHQAGDELLRNLATLLQEQIDHQDILARLGGDEFAILLPQTSLDHVSAVTHKLLAALENHVVIANGQPVRITASIGATLFPSHGTIADELLARADVAMYRSKDLGRNCFSLYTPDTNWQVQVKSRNVWKNRIREALEQDLLVLHCQPILDLRTNAASCYELLLRMQGREGELIAPNVFLPIAESCGLIYQIDRWVVKQAINLIAAHAKAGSNIRLEVNISGKSLSDSELLPLIQQQLAITGIPPASLVLEITETSAIADLAQARKFIHTLKQIGCKFALDDFGMGYSSFAQLKHLPVDYLKIDGSFIRNLSKDLLDRHLVKAIIEVAQGLAISTIAEFVADAETLQILSQLGVDYAQGYYIGKPTSVELLCNSNSQPSMNPELLSWDLSTKTIKHSCTYNC